jgi:hypothetical protein
VDFEELWEWVKAAWRLVDGPQGFWRRYWLSRTVFLRAFGFIYAVAFGSLLTQLLPLLGSRGLLPVGFALEQQRAEYGAWASWQVPTIFWLDHSDTTLWWTCAAGLALSLVVMAGRANAVIMFVLWALYLSFVDVGQRWFAFGWESQLCEMGFLAIFLAPPLWMSPFPPGDPPPAPVFWLYRWLLFRIMLGAGLIKLRGDPCWHDLTCLDTFYETQPNPNPLAWYFHHAPHSFLHAGVLLNHFVELICPFFMFGPRRVRHTAGVIQIGFQGLLILGGNLSFLNWMTAVNALACFDDAFWEYLLPQSMIDRAHAAHDRGPMHVLRGLRMAEVGVLVVLIAVLSLPVVANLLSEEQVMNTSYDRLLLVNTYGAFGSVGEERYEIVIRGTNGDPSDPNAEWREYSFKCIPGPVDRRPCWLSPWHYRLDWLAWFAGFQDYTDHPWLVHLVYQLLAGDQPIRGLMAPDPFGGAAPHAIRVDRFVYRFSKPGSRDWWTRDELGPFLEPLTLDDPRWARILPAFGWPVEPPPPPGPTAPDGTGS